MVRWPFDVVDYITLDWDVVTTELLDKRLDAAPGWLDWAMYACGRIEEKYRIWYRRSAVKRNSWHVKVEFTVPLSRSIRMALRKILWDDKRRWEWDNTRIRDESVVEYSHGVLFDVKDGRRSGTWIRSGRASYTVIAAQYSPR